MQDGDISGKTVPRFLVVFEGLLGTLPAARVAKEASYRRFRRWEKAAGCWDLDERVMDSLWHLSWEHDYRFDVVTHRPAPFAVELSFLLDIKSLPYSNISSATPQELARQLAHMPDVCTVFFADPGAQFVYGGRGRLAQPGVPLQLF